ncbi:putative indoleaminedioxygenase subfamily [Phaeomoniella chlamydospora]|uniref:Indoleamine 2,3-dioxygenase n=1 Tax=Phaeomoniella chlamydospora TaxID=158046 RepID=A0A0G2EHQ5_PHACM|nr:putative indoleaminedioxygenase subfamily [Phaeomoniella chlamydospora]
MEAKGGPSIPIMLRAIAAAREDDISAVIECLHSLAEIIDELGVLLVRMYESCDPHVFYHRIRPYLAGSKNMKDAGLPDGVLYDEGNGLVSRRQYSGGSNAQSSLIQFLDVVLGVEHRPTGEKKVETSESETEPGIAPAPRHNFIQEMRKYMPGKHRRFLQVVESIANIREYVEANHANRTLVLAYDACLAMLKTLRDKHIQMVSRYIIVKSRERSVSRSRGRQMDSRSPEALRRPTNIASTKYRSDGKKNDEFGGGSKKQRGTGGTALIPFLKQARDETGEIAMDAWSRKYLNGGRMTEGDREIENENKIHGTLSRAGDLPPGEVVGLAGSWDMEDSGGGLCSF